MALLPSSNEVTQLQMGGVWAGQSSKEALELAMGGCSQMREAMKEALIRARSQEGMPES
jgi:ribonuclease PH